MFGPGRCWSACCLGAFLAVSVLQCSPGAVAGEVQGAVWVLVWCALCWLVGVLFGDAVRVPVKVLLWWLVRVLFDVLNCGGSF